MPLGPENKPKSGLKFGKLRSILSGRKSGKRYLTCSASTIPDSGHQAGKVSTS